MKNKDIIFHMPKENKEEQEDYQTIMDNTDWSKIYEYEQQMRISEYKKSEALDDRGILNDIDWDSEPKKLIYSNKMLYAFVYHGTDYGLWVKRATQTMDTKDWTEVTSLLDVPMFSYLELRKYAQAIGWIEKDNHNWLIEGR